MHVKKLKPLEEKQMNMNIRLSFLRGFFRILIDMKGESMKKERLENKNRS